MRRLALLPHPVAGTSYGPVGGHSSGGQWKGKKLRHLPPGSGAGPGQRSGGRSPWRGSPEKAVGRHPGELR